MQKVFATLAVTALVALAAPAADEKYASKDGKYTVQFPGGTRVKSETKSAGSTTMQIASVETNGRGYIVMYMDLPDAVKNVPPKTLLDAGEKGGVDNSQGKLVKSKDFAFGKDKLPGREFLVEKEADMANNRIVISGTRLYVITVAGPKDFATSKEATAFLDSFAITK